MEAVGGGEGDNEDDTSTRRSERRLLLSRLTVVGHRTKGVTQERRGRNGAAVAWPFDKARRGGIYMQSEMI